MLEENDRNLIVAKMFRIQLSLKIVFGHLRFNLLCYMYVFLFDIELCLSKKIKVRFVNITSCPT